jgi:hypothetical protein
LLAAANGADVERPFLRLFSLDEIRGYAQYLAAADPTGQNGYVAFAEANDSNPFCVCARGPLEGFVVRVNHDDDAEVGFRSLGTFFAALEQLAARGDDAWVDDIAKEVGEDRSMRTPDDDRRALEILRAADRLGPASAERLWLILLGMQLLSDRSAPVVERYLEDDYFVRRAARETLRAMATDEARKALSADDRAVASFVGEVLNRLRAAGLEASDSAGGGGIQLLPGPVYLDLNAQFHRRAEPGIVEEIVARASQAIEERRPKTPTS